jgi:hypothetical protein
MKTLISIIVTVLVGAAIDPAAHNREEVVMTDTQQLLEVIGQLREYAVACSILNVDPKKANDAADAAVKLIDQTVAEQLLRIVSQYENLATTPTRFGAFKSAPALIRMGKRYPQISSAEC